EPGWCGGRTRLLPSSRRTPVVPRVEHVLFNYGTRSSFGYSVGCCETGPELRAGGGGNMTTQSVGALCFGVVIGWITYRTLRRSSETVALSDIATVVGAVGGAAVTGLFHNGDL